MSRAPVDGCASRTSWSYWVPMMVTIGSDDTKITPEPGSESICLILRSTASPWLLATLPALTLVSAMRWLPKTSSRVDRTSCLPWMYSVLKNRQSGPSTTVYASGMALVAMYTPMRNG